MPVQFSDEAKKQAAASLQRYCTEELDIDLTGIQGAMLLNFILASMFSPHRDGDLGIGFALALPVLYGLLGFVFTAIGCALYNWVAGMVGGIEVQLDGEGGAA